MKTSLLTLSALVLAGCAGASQLPSMQACGDVAYTRHGPNVIINAVCEVNGAHPSMVQPATPTNAPAETK